MEEWKEYKLGDVISAIKEKTNTSLLDEHTYISTENMLPNKAGITTSSGVPSGNAIKFQKGDILVSNIRPYFKKIWQADKTGGCSGDVLCLRASKYIESTYLYFLLAQDNFFDYVMQGTKGTKMPRGDKNHIMQWPILLPSLAEQRRIASILSSLDDKIELNRKINANLEAQAQALFKSWFVDFEPFKDQPFVESELGMIPEGWRVGTVNDVCCFESGFAFKSTIYKQEGEYRLITIKNVQDGYLDVNGSVCLDELPAKMPQYCLLRIGDILLSLTGNVGRCCFVDEERLLLNQRVAKLKPRIKNNWGYIYTMFRNPSFKDRVVSIARGTAQANLSPIETSNMIIIIPTDKVLEDFSAIVDESYRLMVDNMIESRRLASLRDALLPRLMSGELKVNEIVL